MPGSVDNFVRPRAGRAPPPLSLAGMGDAVARIVRAIRQGETILVLGDYDVDGICATALFVRALGKMGARAVPFVPHRLEDGYDLSDAGLRAAQKAGATLILTGDGMPFDMSTTLVLGTCAMADSVEDGVVDPEGRVYNCPGRYITDGSVIPASLGVNPYFSNAANAERLAAASVAEQRRGWF